MTKEWAYQMASEMEELIVITNGVNYKAVSPVVFEVGGFRNHGWYIEHKK